MKKVTPGTLTLRWQKSHHACTVSLLVNHAVARVFNARVSGQIFNARAAGKTGEGPEGRALQKLLEDCGAVLHSPVGQAGRLAAQSVIDTLTDKPLFEAFYDHGHLHRPVAEGPAMSKWDERSHHKVIEVFAEDGLHTDPAHDSPGERKYNAKTGALASAYACEDRRFLSPVELRRFAATGSYAVHVPGFRRNK